MIFVVISIFMISVFGSAIFLLAGEDSTNSQTQEEIAEQARQLQEQQQAASEIDERAANCTPLPATASEGARPLPDFEIPTDDVTELESIDLTVGDGAEAAAGDCIVAYYHGVLQDGTVFDSAFERGTPNRFSLLRVIEGWQVGVPGMKEGGVRVLNIPSEQAYGTVGSPPTIGPDADLTFVIELVEVVEI